MDYSSNPISSAPTLVITNTFYILYKTFMSIQSIRNSLLIPLQNIQFKNRSPRRSRIPIKKYEPDINEKSFESTSSPHIPIEVIQSSYPIFYYIKSFAKIIPDDSKTQT